MAMGTACQLVFVGLALALTPVQAAAVAVSPKLPIAETTAAAPDSVQPVSKAVIGSGADLAQPSVFLADVPAKPAYRRMGPPVFAGLSVLEIMAIGGVLIAAVMFARRRHRRRLAWGMVPDRTFGWMRRAG